MKSPWQKKWYRLRHEWDLLTRSNRGRLSLNKRLYWTRASDGLCFGVCKGIAPQLGLSTLSLRILWGSAFFFFGLGFFMYIVCAICLPKEDAGTLLEEPLVLGVCKRISRFTGIEIGLIRCLFTVSIFFSVPIVSLVYLVLAFALPHPPPRVEEHSFGTIPEKT